MAGCENNIDTTRADERRSYWLGLTMLIAGAILLAVGFFAVPWRKGEPNTEYEFNRAVVTNDLPGLKTEKSKGDKNTDAAKPSDKKTDDDFCPT